MHDPHRIPESDERRRFGPPWPEEAGRRGRRGFEAAADLRALGRLFPLAAWFTAGYAVYAARRLITPAGSRARLARAYRFKAARDLLRLMGIRLVVEGPSRAGRALVVANHLSWLDAVVLLAVSAPAPVALERTLPGFGAFVRSIGGIIIARSSISCLPAVVDGVERTLRSGEDALFFPEGTTGFGGALKPFHPALFEAAARARAPLACCLLAYRVPPPQPSPERSVHWVDWTPFLVHFWRILGLRGLEAHVHRAEPLPAPETRRAANATARSAIEALAGRFPPAPAAARAGTGDAE
ncbi:MAG: 1-acyl-sn-glycerol-3-phosphate acyltransferase [Spirochaetaceae bacterium]|nr:1-acyl-sn-glycerol-3-phosphate acyltransferase [Spirochaetaceae bacterium]